MFIDVEWDITIKTPVIIWSLVTYSHTNNVFASVRLWIYKLCLKLVIRAFMSVEWVYDLICMYVLWLLLINQRQWTFK